ncbi:trehalose operon repressor [Vibrio zhanjiangensis]|uniref:Trehalose operon repressor n=1 Tax=Vibrio zhanjiangensis TaxID=1046128 RepID=A0ABQ6EW88_9VIBR|nr:trehalose operon repressor TreR [Vibrio zhanjiangensis]GLT16797.1 trehalose operon repressor [Vibrio zhanjiangensis]
MSKKLTIVDIAKLSGVGKSTVSRVLTNDPKVKAATREKVERVIKQSGYVPSKSAQAMRGGSQKVVGVIISRLDSPSENRAVGSMLQVLYRSGYDAVIMESQLNRQLANEHLEVLGKRNVDGVIVFGFSHFDVERLAKWQGRSVVIAMDTKATSSINYDNDGVIRLALDHLYRQGMQEIAFIGVDPSDQTTGHLRLQAYLAWCHQYGHKANYRTGQLNLESAYNLVDQVLAKETQAISCASDTLALGVIKRLQELGREDIMVTGVGGSELLSFLFPNVFSIDPGYAKAGEKAANLLISMINGEADSVHLTQSPVLT